MTPRAVIFDCDGVLVDSEAPAFEMMAEEFTRHGLPLSPEDVARDYVGGTMRMVWHRARAAGASLPDDWVEKFYVRLYARLGEGTPLIAGIEAVLDALDGAGIPYAVGSNGSPQKMQVTLGQHPAVMARFEGRLFSGQELGAPKPEPGLYLHAAQALGVAAANCVVVEDSPTGCIAARRAGIPCCGFAAHDDGERLAAEGARVFHRMADLPGLLGLGRG
ncbi:HAD family hydrolase [Acidimangrovimonas pyrenivorans]|uniref:phosphoglycolate phosphatase n=1 Tax=Acidimangrovimonas pyrenivorans TaxID=2030798 RepID=A0ABV7ACD6_9RHOB